MSVPQRRIPAVQRGARLTRRVPAESTSTSDVVRWIAGGPGRGRSRRQAPLAASGGPHSVELAGLLHELTVRLLSADRLGQALDRLAVFGASALPGVARCSVALIGEGGPLTRAGAGAAGETFDEQMYARSTGPGLEAARTRSLVVSGDLADDERWPELGGAARVAGVRAVLAVPLDVRRSSVGALSLYLGRAGDIDPELLLTAMAVAGQAEVLLGELQRREGLSEGAEVDRAVGVIIAQRGCGVQEAYAILQESAQRLGLDRRSVAERLLIAAARNA
ncbi:GAF and ANTAR domain-containing protein [Actinoplanes aureus]|uniref:GAF and ANTAR domain-containing protein n=1 Tax=Actinoplanes aureus TaxID=2792083 RepID=A0A931G468_9ACTN|nr:GAF and ANTAR domain-containing protein [Actinoplanes aureus]MBG0567676.1 GAF and ANTAR domain-containing protein [Actinoplanes aureus]